MEDVNQLSEADLYWLQTSLIPWGLLKSDRKSNVSSFSSEDIPLSVRDFVTCRCSLDAEAEIVGSTLYEAYRSFCEDEQHPPLLRKDFDKTLIGKYSLTRYRPHYTRESNPYYFKGIRLFEESEGRILPTRNSTWHFSHRLDHITSTITNALGPLPSPYDDDPEEA